MTQNGKKIILTVLTHDEFHISAHLEFFVHEQIAGQLELCARIAFIVGGNLFSAHTVVVYTPKEINMYIYVDTEYSTAENSTW